MSGREGFPTRLFLIYASFFSCQVIYDTYMSLYLSSIGFSASKIGFFVSIATACLFVAQPLWGLISDRAASKNRVLLLMYLLTGVIAVGFYLFQAPVVILLLLMGFFSVFTSVIPLYDDLCMSLLAGGRWDYGRVRMGGSLGYVITAGCVGFLVGEEYRRMFLLLAFCMLACFTLSLKVPPVSGMRKGKSKTSFTVLLRNKTLMGLVLFNFLFWLGLNFFFNFYSLHFVALGGSSVGVGWMMLACTLVEVPCMFLMGRLVARFGVRRMITAAGLITALRWLGLAVVTSPALAVAINLSHGFCYATITYCLVQFISNNVPSDLRASSQSFNNLLGIIVSRFLVGSFGGIASDRVGTPAVLAALAVVVLAATVVFWVWSRSRKDLLSQQPSEG